MIRLAMCAVCAVAITATSAEAKTFKTTFRLEYPAAKLVYVMGDFNNWETGAAGRMTRNGRVWTRTLELEEGVHLYKFRVIGETALPDSGWMSDPANPLTVPFHTNNSIKIVPAGRKSAQIMADAMSDIEDLSRLISALIASGETTQLRDLAEKMKTSLAPVMMQFMEQWKVWTQKRIDLEKSRPDLAKRATMSAEDLQDKIERLDGTLNYFLATDDMESAEDAVIEGAAEIVPWIIWMEETERKNRTATTPPRPASGAKTIGKAPPGFDSVDINGGRVSLEALKGNVVLIDFWATWCGPCIHEMPQVKELYSEYAPKGLKIIGISLDQDEDALRAYIKNNDIPWPQLFDGGGWGSVLPMAYGIQSIPSTILLDREGRVVAADLRGERLKAKVAELLK